jgi:hypothetical protein
MDSTVIRMVAKQVVAVDSGESIYDTRGAAIMALRHVIAFTPAGLTELRQAAQDADARDPRFTADTVRKIAVAK